VNLARDGERFDVSSPQTVSAEAVLAWRRDQLALGGRSVDLDWLLDLGAGLRWSQLQRLLIDRTGSVVLTRSLDELAQFWRQHLEQEVPLQYLIGICPWRDVLLEVSPAALIPRQETEVLVDLALECFSSSPPTRWIDLGTGSGAIAVSFSRAWPEAEGHAVDCSVDALGLAQRNLDRLTDRGRCQLHEGNWWEALPATGLSFDLVVSNPPYIPSALVGDLDGVVRRHEPHLALSGGRDGLNCLRDIIDGATAFLSPGGWLLLEHHHDQSEAVLSLMTNSGLCHPRAGLDLSGIKRFALAQSPGRPNQ